MTALGLLLALGAVVAAPRELVVPPITRVALDNGLRVVVAEYHELPLVEFVLLIGGGAAADPPEQAGVAALTASTLTRGTDALPAPALARTIDSLGGRVQALAGAEGTTITAEFLAGDFAAGLELLRQVVREPAFTRDEVRRAREEQEAGLVAALEDPSTVADKCFAAFLYGTHPYGRPIDGRTDTVSRLGRGDVRDYYDRWYRPNGSILVVVGDVDAADAVGRVREAFGGWPRHPDAVPVSIPPPVAVTTRRVLLVDKPDATQTQLRFGNVALARNAPDYLPAQVANTILGGGFTSRLIEQLRVKRSLTYSAWSAFVGRRVGGDFRVSTFTKSPTTAETLALALEVEGTFRGSTPRPGELEKAKSYLQGQFPLRLESPDALAARLAEIEFFGLPADELSTYRGRVAAVGPADVARVTAAHMPVPDAVAVVVVGNAAAIEAQLGTRVGPVEKVTPAACERLATPAR